MLVSNKNGGSRNVALLGGSVEDLIEVEDGWIACASNDNCIYMIYLDGHEDTRCPIGFATSSDVTSLFFDAPRWRLITGLRDGRFLVFAVEPKASDLAAFEGDIADS